MTYTISKYHQSCERIVKRIHDVKNDGNDYDGDDDCDVRDDDDSLLLILYRLKNAAKVVKKWCIISHL